MFINCEIGKGYDGVNVLFSYIDNHYEKVGKNSTYTTKAGKDFRTNNQWNSIIENTPQFNYVRNTGSNRNNATKWKEQWYDNYKGRFCF